jgi:phosphoglycerate kinase
MILPLIQNADLKNKIVLLRVDHNVVKKGIIKDPFRIEASLKTINFILEKGGHPVIMSHVGRPKDKTSGQIEISENTSVQPIVNFLEISLNKKIEIPQIIKKNEFGIISIDMQSKLQKIREGKLDLIYLPNTRWFAGEESGDEKTLQFGLMLSEFCDLFVNDAFGSWQPHASTMEPAKHLPSYAGFLMQREIENLKKILDPQKPFLAVIAGSKFDTKIGPLTALLQKADHLLMGGVIYNAYLCARYNIEIKGIEAADIASAEKFLNSTASLQDKLIEIPYIVESELPDKKTAGKFRTIAVKDLQAGMKLNYVLDADESSFDEAEIKHVFKSAKTLFINAVMGFTPHFTDGSKALYETIAENQTAMNLFGGGDTLQEFRTLLPELYKQAADQENYYFFTGGGTILKVIQEGSPYELEPVKALLKE